MSIQVNMKKLSLVAVAVIGTLSSNAASSHADANPGDASRARQEAVRAQMMQMFTAQSASVTPQNAQQMWQSVSNAPNDFPAPVFSGTETVFLMAKMPQGIPGFQNVSQMTLRTKDSPTSVNQWYQNSLARAGLTLDNSGPQVMTVGYRVLKAKSEKMSCSILIYGRESSDFDTTVNITTIKK